MSKSLFFFLLVALLATAAGFQSGGPWLGEVRSLLESEGRADEAAIIQDVREIRFDVKWAPRAWRSVWKDVQSSLRSVGSDTAEQARETAKRLPVLRTSCPVGTCE